MRILAEERQDPEGGWPGNHPDQEQVSDVIRQPWSGPIVCTRYNRVTWPLLLLSLTTGQPLKLVTFLTRIYNYYHFVIDSFNVIQVFQWFLPHALVLVPWSWQFLHITVDNIEDDNTDITNLQTIKLVVVMMMARSLLLWIHVQQN